MRQDHRQFTNVLFFIHVNVIVMQKTASQHYPQHTLKILILSRYLTIYIMDIVSIEGASMAAGKGIDSYNQRGAG